MKKLNISPEAAALDGLLSQQGEAKFSPPKKPINPETPPDTLQKLEETVKTIRAEMTFTLKPPSL